MNPTFLPKFQPLVQARKIPASTQRRGSSRKDCKYRYGSQSGHLGYILDIPPQVHIVELGTDLDYTLPQIADFRGIGPAPFNLTRG
jgi:hypothetical protein